MFHIRSACLGDAVNVSQLIKGFAHCFVVDEEVAETKFLPSMEPESIAELISSPNFIYEIAESNAQLIGVVALRKPGHLYHLFVAQQFQGKGYSRLLWEHILQLASSFKQEALTVNASINAIPVYEAFGFKVAGELTTMNGVRFLPMKIQVTW